MKTQHIIIRYAHCTKFTRGQLDSAPWSSYELREVLLDVDEILPDDVWGASTFQASLGGRVLALEDTVENALGVASYNLMAESRATASKLP